jgi:hypothetical protein
VSAGLDHIDTDAMVVSSLDGLPPKMRSAVEAALKECNDERLDAVVYESHRSDELQRIYWARGRRQTPDGKWEVVDPDAVVTHAPSAEYGWHFFWLAVDVISASMRWDVPESWRSQVTAIFKRHGLDAGADWPHPDAPHYQWGECRTSPSDRARSLYAEGGLEAVWKAVGAE